MVEKRGTTDIIMLLLIIAMWVTMSGVGGDAVKRGNIYRLLGPINEQGSICGIDPSVADTKYFYPVVSLGLGVCVKSCPSQNVTTVSTVSSDYYCLDAVNDILSSYQGATTETAFGMYIKSYCFTNNQYTVGMPSCLCNVKRASHSVFRRCVFNNLHVYSQYVDQKATSYMTTFMTDIIAARNVIFGFGFAVALVSAFLFIYLMSIDCLAWIVTWSCIFSVLGLMVILIGLAWTTTKKWASEVPQEHTTDQINALKAFCIIMFVLSCIYVCLMLCMCSAINVAIKCVELASMAVREMPFIVLSPILQIAAFVVFMIPLVFYMLNLASDGEFVPVTKSYTYLGVTKTVQVGKTYKPNEENQVGTKLWFLFFCMLWTMNFIAGIGSMVIAMAVSTWYFTEPVKRGPDINNMTLVRSYGTVLRFHAGTVAFGSLLIAIVQFCRAVALYMQKHTTEAFRAQCWVKVVFCCINCCLACMECCLKFISKNAYIQTAIHGTGFMTSCKSAFFTIARNIMRIGALATVSGMALFVGKLFATALATATSYYYFTGAYQNQLHDFVAPTILVAIIAWMTATMFMDVMQMAVDTILICYISDEESNGGKAVYADSKMSDFVTAHGEIKPDSHTHSKCCCCSTSSSGSEPVPSGPAPGTPATGTELVKPANT